VELVIHYALPLFFFHLYRFYNCNLIHRIIPNLWISNPTTKLNQLVMIQL